MTTYDVAVFQVPPSPAVPDLQQLWGGDGGGRLLTGIRKLAQRFLLELLTIRGTIPFHPTRGSDLLSYAKTGQIRSEVDAHVLFQYAVGQVEVNLRADELTTDELDEQYASVSVVSVTFTPIKLIYRLTLTSRAGNSRVVTLPLAV